MVYCFERKYCWMSRQLELELKKIEQKIMEERQIEITLPQITHQLALDLRDKRIVFDPKIIRFKQKTFIQFDENEKEDVKKVTKNAAII